MKTINFLMLALLAFIIVALPGSVFAQSTDRDHPIPLRSNEITGNLDEHNEEQFYSFTAGPGELTITVDVKGIPENQALLNFELLERNAATSIICCEFAQGNDGGTGRDVKSVKLTRRQTVILHTTNGPIGGGTFRIRLSGPALGGNDFANTNGNYESVENNRNNNSSRNQISVPLKGTLRIKMKNGSTKEIDLSLVKDISVQP